MNHLTDELLYEYLDNEIADRALVESHLAACPECAARLSDFQSLFAELESLPDVALSRSLASPFIKTYSLPRWLTLTAVLQSAIALATIIIAAPFAINFLPAIEPSSLLAFISEIQSQWTAALDMLSQVRMPVMPEIHIAEFSSLMMVLAGVSILWLLGNGVLLKNQLK